MSIVFGLLLILALLIGAASAWLLTMRYYEQVAAERDEEEREMAEFQELYAAWLTSHRKH